MRRKPEPRRVMKSSIYLRHAQYLFICFPQSPRPGRFPTRTFGSSGNRNISTSTFPKKNSSRLPPVIRKPCHVSPRTSPPSPLKRSRSPTPIPLPRSSTGSPGSSFPSTVRISGVIQHYQSMVPLQRIPTTLWSCWTGCRTTIFPAAQPLPTGYPLKSSNE